MEKLEYIVRFNTPAFLGNAFQKGQWRTPPFKALLRQWWRVVKACEIFMHGKAPDEVHKLVREAEGRLFGHAWLTYKEKDEREKHWAMQSGLKIYLSSWKTKTLNSLPKVEYVCHPEVDFKKNKNKEQFYCEKHKKYHLIDPLLYLGYGAIFGKRINDPISLDDKVSWRIASRSINNEIKSAIKLIQIFGTIGGRSRNGWGSLILEEQDSEPLPEVSDVLDIKNKESREWIHKYARDWKEALDLDWCHAIGKDDEGLLFWRSKDDFPTWQEAMRHLAEVKIALRTKFHFKGAGPHSSLCDRQILAYPVTKHSLGEWGNQGRFANQLFFKVHRMGTRYVPIVVHLPHGIPRTLRDSLNYKDRADLRKRESRVWKEVHEVLRRRMKRLP